MQTLEPNVNLCNYVTLLKLQKLSLLTMANLLLKIKCSKTSFFSIIFIKVDSMYSSRDELASLVNSKKNVNEILTKLKNK